MSLQEPEWVFPFESMEVGDSFFVPTLRPSPILYAIENGAKRADIRIKAYISSKEGHLGVRAWRIK